MQELPIAGTKSKSIPVHIISDIKDLPTEQKTWAKANGFKAQSGRTLLCANTKGALERVFVGKSDQPLDAGKLASTLPAANYHFEGNLDDAHLSSLGWMLGAYRFSNYNNKKDQGAKLVLPDSVDADDLVREAEASYLARDLINTPANDMGPDELEKAIRTIGRKFKAQVSVVKGDALLKKNFPMIHAVGRASVDAPRLIDLKWGNSKHPKVTLVGKGVIFDSGGLNIKPGNSMALMKKDMGGAANTIALAQMIMDAKLPVRLRLLVPAVENAISGNAFRPGDILPSRKGLSVEIGNTDAEGRLILGDALALGDEEKPDLMIDMEIFDPLWHMPLWDPYQKMLSSKTADVNHISTGGFAGSITAALFLSRFVENAKSWAHFDIYGWTPTAKPWLPVGGEAQGIRTLFEVIKNKYWK